MTLKQFINYVHEQDCKKSTAPAYAVPKKKYSLTKMKTVQKEKFETVADELGLPKKIVIEKAIKKQVPDTNGITRLILDYLRYYYKSKSVRRISSEGKYRVGVGFIPSSNKGMSDIEGVVNGKFLSLELKIGKDSIRESQLKRKAEIESDGGIYYLCKWVDFESFQEEIKNILK